MTDPFSSADFSPISPAAPQPKPKRPVVLIGIAAVAIAAAFGLGLVVGSSDDATATDAVAVADGANAADGVAGGRAETATEGSSNGDASSAAGSPEVISAAAGDPVEAPGATLTIEEVTTGYRLEIQEGITMNGEPIENPMVPVSGGKFVFVKTSVENTGQESLDFACGADLQVKLVDTLDRKFDHVENLWLIPSNPDCGKATNPGFTEQVTWVFEVPEATIPAQLAFADFQNNYNDFTYADIG